MSLVTTATNLNNFKDIVLPELPYKHIGNTSGNITLEMNKVTTAHFTGNHTVTLPTIIDTSKQSTCILDFTTTNVGYPSITNSNIKLKDSQPLSYNATLGVSKSVTGASNTTPIEITVTSHGYQTGDVVTIASVGGNTAANGTWTVTKTGDNTFTLNTSVGNGTYTSGGTSVLYGIRNRLIFTSFNGSDNWEVKLENYGGVEISWTQPTLSANGTMGGSSVACESSTVGNIWGESYNVFDNNNSTARRYTLDDGAWVTLYSPDPLKVSQVVISGNSNGGYILNTTTDYVYGSNNNSSWTTLTSGDNISHQNGGTITIPSANRGWYKYYRVRSYYVSGDSYTGWADIDFTATYISV